MCGIVGYVGKQQASTVVIDGLRRLEYRGYDSAGVAIVSGGAIESRKKAGKLTNLEAEIEQFPVPQSHTAIGHTRWATHGAPNDVNAHPHISEDGKIAVIHNGIIENFAILRDELLASGTKLRSETDTEIVAHLLADQMQTSQNLPNAMRAVCQRLTGAFTLVAVEANTPDLVVAARRNSPLVVGRGVDENFLASDVAAFIAHTRNAIELGQDQIVELSATDVVITDFAGNPVAVNEYEVTWDASAAEKNGYDLFMLKEIAEQPKAVDDTLIGRIDSEGIVKLDGLNLSDEYLRDIDKIIISACGTAYHSGLIAKYAIEHWTRVPCEVELASEFRYRDPILNAKTLVIAISQSGETMDTLMAMRYAREQGAKVLAICNSNGSTIPRESDAVIYTIAGPEVAVASTKAFLTQIVACYLFAMYLAQVRDTHYGPSNAQLALELGRMSAKVDLVLDTTEGVRALAREFVEAQSVLFIGRSVGFPVALEGALKLKELAYMHAEGFAAGELKHGPIALLEDGLPVFVVVPPKEDELHDKIVSNIQEVRARGARTIVLAEEDDESINEFANHIIRLPKCPALLQPLVATVPLQIFACEMATVKGFDVDQPRNLAKSVTVE
ncbi:MAG: glutamine--fructose-6-phosphate transaminase (isomerizing) [Actinobacteria bacterium]|nr:glutamine--fructose-6-phosphate transaminase (isomerizing) [Actinomycetota bacterium]NBY15120.1 glutamine--fructose-6-phosphate transaminase (isomerizing) [Actinomycetota bacterium]